MDIPHYPSLVDPVQITNIKKFITNSPDVSKSKQLGGLFGFFADRYKDNLSIIFCIIFFIIVSIFLYYRHKAKQTTDKEKPINEFINSVDQYLYPSNEYYYF